MRIVTHGATDQSIELFIVDSDGLPATGLAYNSSGIDLWYRRNGAAVTSITEATQTANGAHSDGGFVGLGNGVYRLDPPDAAFASGVSHVTFGGTITGYTVYPVTVQLTAFDLQTATQAVNVTQFGGSNGTFASGRPEVNTTHLAGTSQTARDIGASVLLSPGTGTGQISLSSGAVTAGTVSDKTGYALTQAFPSNFASLGINASGHVSRVTLADTVTTLTGHTPQTGDSYARIGSNGSGLTGVPWNASWDAEVQSEVDDALIAKGLDHLVFTSVTGTDIADNSIIARMASKSATADWDSFVNTTDSLEAIRDNGGGGGGGGVSWADLVADNDDVAGSFGKAIADILVDTGTSIPDAIADLDTAPTYPPRMNFPPSPGFTTQVSRRADGTYKCTKPIRLTAGDVENVYVFIDMSPLFGANDFVSEVGTAVVSAGSITQGDDNGPRDTYAVVELSGTADDACTITVPVTMTSGTTVDVVFEVEVLE